MPEQHCATCAYWLDAHPAAYQHGWGFCLNKRVITELQRLVGDRYAGTGTLEVAPETCCDLWRERGKPKG